METPLDQPRLAVSSPSPAARFLRILRLLTKNPIALVGALILAMWIVLAILGPAIAPYGINEITAGAVWKPPSAEHLMGTDQLGRDIFSRLLVGTRQMVILPTLSVALAILLGTTIGLLSGYRGGWVDEIVMRVMDVMMAFPVLMLYLMIIVAIGASAMNVVLALGIGATPAVSRLVRGLVLDLRNREFVAAARMRGESTAYILFQEILPNALGPILVDGLVRIGYACFSMGALGFLGLGVPPPNPDWGQMVSQARNALIITPSAPLFPALAIASLVVSFNLLADGLSEAVKAD
ncbi:MAG: ABC transporter permease [Anaerolineae bacterium]|nr:ABC transporter permease [Anaerolineae bacterium]NUQ04092.1 ABC transporter permease [Anaerolineae bacterium]